MLCPKKLPFWLGKTKFKTDIHYKFEYLIISHLQKDSHIIIFRHNYVGLEVLGSPDFKSRTLTILANKGLRAVHDS